MGKHFTLKKSNGIEPEAPSTLPENIRTLSPLPSVPRKQVEITSEDEPVYKKGEKPVLENLPGVDTLALPCASVLEKLAPNYKTSDFNLAAFLSSVRHKLISFERSPTGSFVFVFENSAKLRSDILSFWNHHAKVDPLEYATTLRNFKAMLVRSE